MGAWLNRLFRSPAGEPDPAAAHRRSVPGRQAQPLHVSGPLEEFVVGTQHHPGGLRRHPFGSRCVVELRPDPGNPYDGNAVAVLSGTTRVGYLRAPEARRQQPGLLRSNVLGYRVLTDGVIDFHAGAPTVRLQLPWPSDLALWLDRPAGVRARGFKPSTKLTLRGYQHHQPLLLAALGTEQRIVVPAQLHPRPEPRQVDLWGARVLMSGDVIGVVRSSDLLETPAVVENMRHGAVVDGGLLIVRYPEGPWAAVLVS